jgi:hypothetical protein
MKAIFFVLLAFFFVFGLVHVAEAKVPKKNPICEDGSPAIVRKFSEILLGKNILRIWENFEELGKLGGFREDFGDLTFFNTLNEKAECKILRFY